jgi:phosphonate transport system substrate-binding protein
MSMFSLKRALFSVALAVLAIPALAAPRTLTFGITEGKAGAGFKEHAALIAYLQARPEYAFSVKVYPSYEALYDAFKANQVDIAAVGPVKYVQARFETGAIPVVAENAKVESAMFASASSPVTTVEQLRGKKFAFGYPESTSTHLMPLLVLSKHHIHENEVLPAFIGSEQQQIVDAVIAGKADAGAVAKNVYEKNKAKLRLLDVSEPFPGPPVLMHKTVDNATIEAVKKIFLGFKPASAEEQKQRYGNGFVAATDADYNKIRFLCKVVLKKSYVK